MQFGASASRSKKPLLHVWASPSIVYSESDWERYWYEFEAEFELLGHQYLEVMHLKQGAGGRFPAHVHRVYSRLDLEGRAVPMRFSAMRIQKLSRISEFYTGELLTSGCQNRSIIHHLRKEGRGEVAEAMVRAGLDQKAALKAVSPAERAMTERVEDLAADEVWRRVTKAWQQSDTGASFVAALSEQGLRLGMGQKVPVVSSPGGSLHPMLHSLNRGLDRKGEARLKKADLDVRLAGLTLAPARSFRPEPDFSAGAFGITGITRRAETDLSLDRPFASTQAEIGEVPRSVVAGAQFNAPEAFRTALAGGGQREAKRVREEARVKALIEQLDHRLLKEKRTWSLPGIVQAGWHSKYQAVLAALPKKYGPHLLWIERAENERQKQTLEHGVVIFEELGRIFCKVEEDSDIDIVSMMASIATGRGWTEVEITGDPASRGLLARAATKAALIVVDADLQEVVQDQKRE